MKKMPLIKRFYTDRYLHIRSFSLSLLTILALCIALYHLRGSNMFSFRPQWWHLALIPLGVYIGGISAVWMHNATHGSFKHPLINDLCGHVAGVHQLWGFTGWKLIHLIHHMYSDKTERDTHPPKGMTFWQFSRTMFIYSSMVVSKLYREHWGDDLKTRLLQRGTLIVFSALVAANLVFWYLLLGAEGFVFFYVPSYAANHLLYCHINYRAHPVNPDTGDTEPTNLNHNLYYKIANALWFGIYFHGNHHRKPLLFNPRYMPVKNTFTENTLPQRAAA